MERVQIRPDRLFVPGNDEVAPQSGQRRQFISVPALPLRWPPLPRERFDLFDAWHDVAMQIVHRAKGGLHLLAAAKKLVWWADGTITQSDAEIASRAGYCSEKTISREVQQGKALGIFFVEMGWRRSGTQIYRTRTLHLSVPEILEEGIVLPPDRSGFDLDACGPDRSGFDLDTCGPGDPDHCGPNTIYHKKDGRDEAA